MVNDMKTKVTFLLVLLLGLSGCASTGIEATADIPTPTIASTTQAYPLATPYAQLPAAGICASFEGEMVVVSINPDVPDPRCAKVRADQKLTVVNRTENTLEVSIGTFKASLEPGAEATFDTPFGDYLAVGVHQLQVSPCCGSELWLEGK
jgi:hypothetical protein